jgi:hypothetical protein
MNGKRVRRLAGKIVCTNDFDARTRGPRVLAAALRRRSLREQGWTACRHTARGVPRLIADSSRRPPETTNTHEEKRQTTMLTFLVWVLLAAVREWRSGLPILSRT